LIQDLVGGIKEKGPLYIPKHLLEGDTERNVSKQGVRLWTGLMQNRACEKVAKTVNARFEVSTAVAIMMIIFWV
jgi:hypothetical protein